ncbi:flagellar biosynthetic protein FliR [Candidatus Poribacteria bacterium]|nr:flagellar biosynthetic protein FliR [Candidatus Poribacteria bacterium]
MNLLDVSTLSAFMLVLFRLSALMLTAPIFGDAVIPARARVGLAFVLALVVFPLLPWNQFQAPTSSVAYGVLIFRELLVGITIGYAARAVFAGIQTAGQVISFQMGLALATTFDPNSGVQNTVVATMYYWAALMVFLAVNGHYFVLMGVVNSYNAIGFGQATFDGNVLLVIIQFLGDIFKVAIQVSAPVTVVLFFTNALLAILGRAMPQMHIFLVGLPVTIGLGFLVLALSTGGVIALFPSLFEKLYEDITLLLRALGA